MIVEISAKKSSASLVSMTMVVSQSGVSLISLLHEQGYFILIFPLLLMLEPFS